MIDITEWMTAVGDSNSVYMSEFDKINEEADIESKSNEEPFSQEFALCDSAGFNVDDSYLGFGWNERTMSRDYPPDDARMKFNEHVTAGEINREVFVRKVMRNIGFDLIIDSLCNFDSEAFNFRVPYKSLLKNSCLERNTVTMSRVIYKWINDENEMSDEEHDLQLKYHDVFNEVHKDMNCIKVTSCWDSMYDMADFLCTELVNHKTNCERFNKITEPFVQIKEEIKEPIILGHRFAWRNKGTMSDVINDTIDISDKRHGLQLNYHDVFNVYNENMIYVAEAVRCDSLSGVANSSCTTLFGRVTNSDETDVADYYMNSGRIGSLRNFKHDFQNLAVFLSPKNGMVGWQNAKLKKQKHRKNDKHAFRSSRQQQSGAQALVLDDSVFIGEVGSNTTEGKYKNLDDGKYEKTIYVKTWKGRTITVKISPERTAAIVKMQIEAKTGIPAGNHHLVTRGRVLMDNMPLKEYGLSGRETIDMTAKLMGGMKHKSLSPTPIDTERDKKRKESEPFIDTSGLENEKSQTESDEDTATTKKWMKDAMKQLN